MKNFNKWLLTLICLVLPIAVFASIKVYDASNTSVGMINRLKCGSGATCTASQGQLTLTTSIGDATKAHYGFLSNKVSATTSGSISTANCGSTYVTGANVTLNLPEASTAVGCRLSIVVGTAASAILNPDDADQIVLLTNSAGDSLWADALGESIILEAISNSQWSAIGKEQGTWTDGN